MSANPVFDSFSCYIDLLGYQKNEITDSICKFLNVETNLLVEGMIICTRELPLTNQVSKASLSNTSSSKEILFRCWNRPNNNKMQNSL